MTVALDAFPAFYDADGNPLSGGLLYTYAAGTNNPLATYTDRGGQTANPNPVVLDSAGRAPVWLTLNVPYKLILQDAAGVVQFTTDDFYGGADPLQLQAAGIVPATGGNYSGPVNFSGGATFSGTPEQDLATLDSLGAGSVQNANLWINSIFQFNQRAAPTATDGNYCLDRTIAIAETGSMGVSQLMQPSFGIPFAMRFTQPDATPKRLGCLQIVEARNSLAYNGRNLVFASKVRCSVAATVRTALVAWTGSQDNCPRDIVNNWGSTVYTAGNFFVADTLTIATSATAISASTWSDVVVSSTSAGGIAAPFAMSNLYLVTWLDTTIPQNATLDFSFMRAGQGTSTPIFTPPDAATEFARCLRYCQVFQPGAFDYLSSNFQAGQNNTYTVPMKGAVRVQPTFNSGWSLVNVTSITVGILTPMNVTVVVTNGNAGQWRITNNTMAYIDAEIG